MSIQKDPTIKKLIASPEAQVLGASMLSLPTCLAAEEIVPVLERHGFGNIDPNGWYPQQNVLKIYDDILEKRTNVSENLVSIGIKSVETMTFPPEINTIEAILTAMATSYGMFHRNIPSYEGTTLFKIGEDHYQMVLNSPYPDDIFYGYYWGVMNKHTPKDIKFRVAMGEPREDTPGSVFEIQWGTTI